MQKSEDNTEKISKTLEKLILQKRIESIPKREVFIGDKQEITKHKDVYFSDASLLNKYRIPINPTKGLKPKIINWVKRKLYTVVKQVTEILVSTQERFNHETISNFSLVNQKIDKINNNNENHIQELLKQNQKLAEALKVIIKSNETNKNNIIAKIDNLKEHIELEIKDVKEHIELEIKDVKEHIELEIKDVKEQINPEIDINYLAFEDTFRQLEDNSQSKQSDYMEFFKGQSNILDIGCGRGEFLETLKYYNIDAKGIDSNDQMISICKNKGLEVEKEDALEFLSKQPDNSLGGIIAIQLIEHLPPNYLLKFIKESFKKLKKGANFIVETPNPECLDIYRSNYVLDITHNRPYHSKTIEFILAETGFEKIKIIPRSPIDEEQRMQFKENDPLFNRNMELLNAYIANNQDYAIIAQK